MTAIKIMNDAHGFLGYPLVTNPMIQHSYNRSIAIDRFKDLSTTNGLGQFSPYIRNLTSM